MSPSLRIVRLVLDRRELLRLARRHGLRRGVDEGYVLHAGLAQLFATSRQRADIPFHAFAVDDTLPRARQEPECVFLLAYSDLDEPALMARMGPSSQSLVRLCQARAVPTLSSGTGAAFRVRICPIVRTRQPVTAESGSDRTGRGRTRELDAWLASLGSRGGFDSDARGEQLPFEHSARVWLGREEIYGTWLARELGRSGGAELDGQPRLTSFKRDQLYRRNAGSGHVLERPNAVMEGHLRVVDAEGFQSVLRRGVGRHRACGFGMLLLRAPGM